MYSLDTFKTFTALDIETTGLEKDAEVIEIGLAHYEDGVCVRKWEKLIKPEQPISEEITLLTGISNDMVAESLPFKMIEQEFLDEIEGRILLAHNYKFDKSHLEYHLGFPLNNIWLDTYELAKIITPCLSGYKLQALAQYFHIADEDHHRALNDAITCGDVYLALLEKGQKLSPFLLDKLYAFFRENDEVLATLLQSLQLEQSHDLTEWFEDTPPTEEAWRSEPNLTFSDGASFFAPDGLLSQKMESFEYRPQQQEMLEIIQKAFLEEKHAIIEAGTGTGKSFAYLIPSLLWGFENDQKVIVSTNTMTLQDQLYHKDLPFLQDVLNCDFAATISKGRTNYLCLRRFELFKNQSSLSKDERLFAASILVWLDTTYFGDREELRLNNLEKQYWQRISCTSETCLNTRCPHNKECFFFKNRREASQSQLIIVNHALLLQHLKLNETILPQSEHIIIDEAHNLEDEATRQFTNEVDLELIRKTVHNLTRPSGLLNKMKKRMQSDLEMEDYTAQQLLEHLEKAHEEISFILEQIPPMINYAQTVTALAKTNEYRLTDKLRKHEWWQNLAYELNQLIPYLTSLVKTFNRILKTLDEEEDWESLHRELSFIRETLDEQTKWLEDFLKGSDTDRVYWISAQEAAWGNNLKFFIAYIDILPLMKEKLFDQHSSVVLTSATLAISQRLKYVANQYQFEEDEYEGFICPSPFDYEKQSLIAVPTHRPDYSKLNEIEYSRFVAEDLESLILSINGSVLVLFTSYAMMNRVSYSLKDNKILKEKGFKILCQGQDGNRSSIIEALSTQENVVVLGASSFWEGVDIKDNRLKAVIIAKLPFAPPTMPIESAKSDKLKEEGKSPFAYLSLPKAILRFRQGCGRLIRSKEDKGVIVILDNRIVKKNYGRQFINSLPQQTMISGHLDDVCYRIHKWFKATNVHD